MSSSIVADDLTSIKRWLIVNVVVSASVLVVLLMVLVAVKVAATSLMTEAKSQIEKFERKAEQLQSQAR
jgi:hypothetical protein